MPAWRAGARVELEIVTVESSDQIAAVAAAAGDIWREHFPKVVGADQIEYMLARFQSSAAIARQIEGEGLEYFLLEVGGAVVGYFAIRCGADGVFLSKLYVRREHRGNGYARAAVDRALERARTLDDERIWLAVNRRNDLAIAAYRRMGFVTVAERCKEIGSGFVMDDFVMELRS